jgi:hypothetical protein
MTNSDFHAPTGEAPSALQAIVSMADLELSIHQKQMISDSRIETTPPMSRRIPWSVVLNQNTDAAGTGNK